MPLIPTNTKLPKYRIPQLQQAIDRRVAILKKLRYGDAEYSLFVMTEIQHLRELLQFNS